MILHGDIKWNDEGLLFSEDGDLVVGEAPEQMLAANLEASAGTFRQYPTYGAGLYVQLDAPQNGRDVLAIVESSLRTDGWRLDELDIDTTTDNVIGVDVLKAVKVTDNTQARL